MADVVLRILADVPTLHEHVLEEDILRVLLGFTRKDFHGAFQAAEVRTIRCLGTRMKSEEFWETVPLELKERIVCEKTGWERKCNRMCVTFLLLTSAIYSSLECTRINRNMGLGQQVSDLSDSEP